MSGALDGVRVLELASIAPGPFAATMLADLGAEVLRIDRPEPPRPGDPIATALSGPLGRGRRSVAIDLKHPAGAAATVRLAATADVLLDGFRPGVCERLGIGPAPCLAANPRLVYARITGWGQTGPLAAAAGHDIDYLAVSGALSAIGPAGEPPVPPMNYVADFGGGGMLAVVGILAALYERERSGRGQVVDAAMVEGAALMTAHLRGLEAAGLWPGERGGNLLDGGAPFYRTYACSDGRYVAVGALEPAFYAALLAGLGLADPERTAPEGTPQGTAPEGAELPAQGDRARWPELTERIAEAFAARSRDAWCEVFAGSDACVAPVLELDEAPGHPHAVSRQAYVRIDGLDQPAPAPRLSRTPSAVAGPAPKPGDAARNPLLDWGFEPAELDALAASGALRTP